MIGIAGKTYPAVQVEIDAGRVADFARSIGANPADGVPPTFAAVYALEATAPQLFTDEDAAVDFARLLHAEQEFEWQRQARMGETVTSIGRVASDTSRRGMRFVSLETETMDARGEGLCRSRALFVIREEVRPPRAPAW